MNYGILFVLLAALVIAFIVFFVWYSRMARKATDQISKLEDTLPWRTALAVIDSINPPEVVQARARLVEAEKRNKAIRFPMDFMTHLKSQGEVQARRDEVDQAIMDNRWAAEAHRRVTMLLTDVKNQIFTRSYRAIKLVPTVRPQVDQIIEQAVQGARRNAKRITREELEDFKLALYDGRFDAWMRELKI